MMATSDKPRRILRLRQVIDRVGMSRESIYREAREGRFPKPMKLGRGHASGWLESEVDDYIQRCVAARDA